MAGTYPLKISKKGNFFFFFPSKWIENGPSGPKRRMQHEAEKTAGRRMTRQRQAIMEMLAKTDEHPTAEMVYEAVRKQLPEISLGTVYRNLQLLVEEGLAREIDRACELACDEAVLHRGSRVTECAHSNISILKDGVLRTAPTDELILPGITRKHLLALAKDHGIPVLEEPFSMVELMNADEVIVTSSSALCMQAASVDGIPVGGKDPQRLKLLQSAYLEKFQRETQPR